MSAIITSQFRLENANNFIDSIGLDENNVYVFIGKSDAWSTLKTNNTDSLPEEPEDTIVNVNNAWQNMIALKKINATSSINLAPRYNWTTGESYVAWDDQDSDIFTKKFYVITDEFKVYKCVIAGSGSSTVKPTHTGVLPEGGNDGYFWKYMFTVSLSDGSKFLTNFYIPVKSVVPAIAPATLSDDDQIKLDNQVANAAQLDGKIFRYNVTNGGANYTSAPTVAIRGNGTGAFAVATLGTGASSGKVTQVTILNGNFTNAGSGYDVAFVELSGGGGSEATVEPVLSPYSGHGTDPVKELGAFFVGVYTTLENDDSQAIGDFIVDGSFRQLGIIKNPELVSSGAYANTYSALNQMNLGAITGTFNPGDFITNTGTLVNGFPNPGPTDAVAFIDDVDTSITPPYIKYHQNDKTGYVPFVVGNTIRGGTGGVSTIATSGLISSLIEKFSGEMLFLENRKVINRTQAQIEDIKIIIEF